MILISLMYLWALFISRFLYRARNTKSARYQTYLRSSEVTRHFAQAKPPWVVKEVIRLKALMPHAGCRHIAAVFNRLHAHRKVSVSKTYVNDTIRRHLYDILIRRRKIKHRIPPVMPKNLIWQIDLTGKSTEEYKRQSILGIIDHGTRACVTLRALPRKTTLEILICLLKAMKHLGVPHVIRTDNEAIFLSRLFRLCLRLLSVRHQRTDPHCPWQNGRIERMFLTLKQSLDRLLFLDITALNGHLGQWRFWYNHVRPHQHLGERVPAEVWQGDKCPVNKTSLWFEDDTGLLRGYYFPP